ncbi:acyltransferase domain-containing protein [Nonomuraea sp. SBT364]|uniref:acyltransferase domain-containing protein n=1 Tax=Nonomuraea sp. SBT364 TaxID=1580530 RepID=UPI000A9D32ED|nr:acyltransferase domain-containing protein [Nonomuraea sp. SBT364]
MRDLLPPALLDHLESVGPIEITLPPDPVAELLRLAVPHEDVAGVLAARPRPGTEAWWLLERCVHTLVSAMGELDDPPQFPELPDPYFYVYVYLAAAPHVRAYHRSRGIPDDVASRTLADLGRNMAVHRKRHGAGGLNAPFWLMLHFRGLIYDLGRLQFQRAGLGTRTAEAIRAEGLPCEPGEPVLSVHIPDFLGPMTPAACDAAFDRAAEFFPRYFPEEKPRYAVCHSWLLDDQLAGYLPEESNIIRFQRRFRQAYRHENDGGIVAFVFGADGPDLPRRTNLERAVGDHLRAGRTWHLTSGWTTLPEAPAG